MEFAKEITQVLNEEDFETVEGYENTLEAIARVADSSTGQLCSGYKVFPDGKKCKGCSDCKTKLLGAN